MLLKLTNYIAEAKNNYNFQTNDKNEIYGHPINFGRMMNAKSNDNKEIGKETDKLSKDLKDLEKAKKDVDGNFKEAEKCYQ